MDSTLKTFPDADARAQAERQSRLDLIDALSIPAVNKDKMITIEITSDPTDARILVQELVNKLRGPEKKPVSRATALAVTKLQEAAYWLGEAAFGGE